MGLVLSITSQLFIWGLTHPFEIDRQSPLQLVRTHPQNLQPLLVVDVWVVMLVEDRETIVSTKPVSAGSHSIFNAAQGRIKIDAETKRTVRSHARHMVRAPEPPDSPASTDSASQLLDQSHPAAD